ncbi:MAG TPA: hypothetical protein VGO85_03335 [Caldimonas sp.]|nr:hypothetical protein [Caldimonas sp.]
MIQNFTRLLLAAGFLSLFAPFVLADGVSVRNDVGNPAGAPFPSNRYTVFDGTQNTLRRVRLPKPNCAVQVSDCQDIDVINTLDGFSTQPRITVPFTGDIDVASVDSDTIFLVNLGDTLTLHGFGDRVGINQVLWDPATKTLVFESDQLLKQHSRYLLVITDGVHDSRGRKIKGEGWDDDDFSSGHDRDDYRRDLRDGVQFLRSARNRVVAASLFTTQSTSADLVKINHQIKHSTPAPVDFMIGNGGTSRAVFPVATLAGVQFNRQTGTTVFTPGPVPTSALGVVPGAVGAVAYGRFRSPDYETAEKVIPPTGTLTGQPQPQGSNDLIVQVFLPAVQKPARGWPVAIFGHGFGDSMYGAPWTVAATLASQGIATISINVVGHGGGSLGTLNVTRTTGTPVVVPAGGRGIDQDGNGTIDSTEGSSAVGAKNIVSSRDGLRQTVVDLMQLVRQVEAGMDVDGDGSVDLDAQRIYYSGQSFGGIYGTIFLGVEPSIKAGVPNVAGGSIIEIVRLSPVFRVLGAIALASRQPALLNLPPLPPPAAFPFNLVFNENIPLRNQPPVINTVPGALAIAERFDRTQWVSQSGNPVSYAPFIRKEPLHGNAAKPVIFQFAKGDMTVPNPTTSAILRAGALADRATYFRNDLAFAHDPAVGKNPHTFLTNIFGAGASYAVAAQRQIATFFSSNGATTIDPDGLGPYFETPITSPLPETLNFIP